MYADDTSLFSYTSNKHEDATVLNQDLEKVPDLVSKLALNISRTKRIVFGSRNMLNGDTRLHLFHFHFFPSL